MSPYEFVRVFASLLLLCAAILKAHETTTGPGTGDGSFAFWSSTIGQVLFELLFGLVLLSNLYPRVIWLSASGLFTVFAAVAFLKGIFGAESCGCFGRVQVNPWWTFGLDVVILTVLLRWRPSWRDQQAVGVPGVRMRLGSVGALFLLIGGPAVYLMATSDPTRLTVEGVIAGDGNLVILEPETWVGHPLPVRPYINVGDQLMEGRWTLLLYHRDCPKCQEVIPRYEQAAWVRDTTSSRDGVRIALVEMPPYGYAPQHSFASPIVYCRVSEERDWFVQTPVEIQVEDGRVTQVSTEMKFLQSSRDGRKLRVPLRKTSVSSRGSDQVPEG